MSTRTTPNDQITWTAGGRSYSLDLSTPTSEILVENIGWCTAKTLYTLGGEIPDGWATWRVMELTLESHAQTPRDSLLVVEVSHESFHHGEELHEDTRVRTWFVPKALAASPKSLVGSSMADLTRNLLIDSALATSRSAALPLAEAFSEELPGVPIASIPLFVHNYLRKVADEAAPRAGFAIREPIAAAYSYSEVEGSNMNQTVACTWVWRLGFATDHGGILTLQVDGLDVDANESDGPLYLSVSPRAWLAIPAEPQCVTWGCPGVPLALLIDENSQIENPDCRRPRLF